MDPRNYLIAVLSVLILHLPVVTLGEDMPMSGFFDDYSRLESMPEVDWVDYMYRADNFREKLAAAKAIVIPQPEFFVAPDSKYKGIKPENLTAMADGMRQLLVEAFEDGYQIANNAGPDTIVLRIAFSNLYLKKKGRTPFVGYLPQVYLMTSAKRAMLDDFADKIQLTEVVWEGELSDAESGEIVGEILLRLGNNLKKREFSSWDELVTALSVGAARLRCQFDNAPLPDDEREDCVNITADDIDLGGQS